MVATAQKHSISIVGGADSERLVDLDELQGTWSESQYLKMTQHTNKLIEFTDGTIEVLTMPTYKHQQITRFLLFIFYAFLQPRGGQVMFAPLRLHIGEGRFREPDLLVALDKNDPRLRNDYWRGADVVVEVVSPDNPERDIITKRKDYEEAGIPEYWIVNPEEETITVLVLVNGEYSQAGVFTRKSRATSVLLEGFSVSVDEVLDAE